MPLNTIRKEDQEREKGRLGTEAQRITHSPTHSPTATTTSSPCREILGLIGLENDWKRGGAEAGLYEGQVLVAFR